MVLLLTHAELGRDEPLAFPRVPRLAGLFVALRRCRPALVDHCDRHRTMGADPTRLVEVLTSLLS